MHEFIHKLCLLRGPTRNNTPVAMSSCNTQILFLNTKLKDDTKFLDEPAGQESCNMSLYHLAQESKEVLKK